MAAELASEVGPVRPGADDAGVAGHDAVLIFRGARASGAERSRAVVGIGEVMERLAAVDGKQVGGTKGIVLRVG